MVEKRGGRSLFCLAAIFSLNSPSSASAYEVGLIGVLPLASVQLWWSFWPVMLALTWASKVGLKEVVLLVAKLCELRTLGLPWYECSAAIVGLLEVREPAL